MKGKKIPKLDWKIHKSHRCTHLCEESNCWQQWKNYFCSKCFFSINIFFGLVVIVLSVVFSLETILKKYLKTFFHKDGIQNYHSQPPWPPMSLSWWYCSLLFRFFSIFNFYLNLIRLQLIRPVQNAFLLSHLK